MLCSMCIYTVCESRQQRFQQSFHAWGQARSSVIWIVLCGTTIALSGCVQHPQECLACGRSRSSYCAVFMRHLQKVILRIRSDSRDLKHAVGPLHSTALAAADKRLYWASGGTACAWKLHVLALSVAAAQWRSRGVRAEGSVCMKRLPSRCVMRCVCDDHGLSRPTA
jgi:hypothetical protein